MRLFQSDAEYFAFESMRHPADAGDAAADGAAMDAGNDAGLGVDWSRESLLVTISRGSGEYTFGVEGDALVVSIGQFCSGAEPPCYETARAVPKVTHIVTASCPPPSEPCTAP
jgi:hypothetical protein